MISSVGASPRHQVRSSQSDLVDSPSLDLPKTNCNPSRPPSESLNYCPNSPGYFKSPDGLLFPAPCKSWTCPYCGPKRKYDLLWRLEHGYNVGGLRWRFLTLTMQTRDPTRITAAWARFRAYLAKRGYRFKFVWVKEFTLAGKRHLHILISAYIPWRILRAGWLAATSGHSYIVDIRAHKGKIRSLGGYMSKYISKSLVGVNTFLKRERRFMFSQWVGWHVNKPIPQPGWSFVLDPFARYDTGEYMSMPEWNAKRDRLERRDRVAELNRVPRVSRDEYSMSGGVLVHRVVYPPGVAPDHQSRLPVVPEWSEFWL